MSKIAVNEITNEAGTGGPTLPNGIAGGLTLGGDLTLDTNGIYLGGTGSANYLDDYEEGTFTPALAFGGSSVGISYDQQFGRYTKIGDTVHIKMRIALLNAGSSTGTAEITGLPFPPTDNFSNVSFEKSGYFDTWNQMATASNYRFVYTDTGDFRLQKIDTNTISSFGDAVDKNDFTSSSDLRVTFTYHTTS